MHTADVLLVDDNTETLVALEALLADIATTTTTVHSGEEALKYLLDHEVAIVVLDVHLPGIDGFETASLIRQRDRSKDTPIIFLTGIDSDATTIAQGYAIGAVDFLHKPVVAEALRAKVINFVDRYEKTHALQNQLEEIKRLHHAAVERERRFTQEQVARITAEAMQRRYRLLFENATDAIFIADRHARYVDVNHQAELLSGYSRDELLRMTVMDTAPEPLRKQTWEAYEEFLRRGSMSGEYEIQRKDGTIAYVEFSATEIFPGEYQSIIRDITERKHTEAQLREQAEIIETVNRVGQAVSAELDLEKLIQLVTDAATELTDAQFGAFFYNTINDNGEAYMLYTLSGAPREAFERFPMPRNTGIFGPTFRGDGVVRLADVTQDPRYGNNPPLSGMPSGHLPVVSYLAVPVISRSGKVIGGLFFGHPKPGIFTERAEQIVVGLAAQTAIAIDNAQLYQEAHKAVQDRDEFLSVAAHELKTPITSMRGFAQLNLRRLSKEGAIEPQEVLQAFQLIDEQAIKLTRLVNQLLDISRLEAGRLALDPQPTDVTQLVETVVSMMQATTDKHTLIVHVPGPLTASIDTLRLEQAVTNLVDNAIKYSPGGGPVEIELSTLDDKTICIAVTDNGIGIASEHRPHIFSRFFQAHTGRHFGGLGLGLYISRQIIELHGGTLEAEFPEGGGTRFVIRLPV
jgi:PAS domain S-box-containing protein